jgi:hypothetical protein
MGFYRHILSLGFLLFSGCASIAGGTAKDIYKQGYQQGVREQVKQVASEFQGGNFPYYHWVAPIVQEVRVPAHVSHSAMIPEHNELVIIQPGQWTMNQAYPIESQQRKNDDNQITNKPNNNSDITALPLGGGRPSSHE